MGRVTVNKGNGMTNARATAAVGLFFGVALMTSAAWAQPATQPPAEGAAPAAQPADPAAAPAGTEPAPPAIGPDGLPVAAPADPAAAAPAEEAPPAEEKKHSEITPYKMFAEASIVVQAVMVLLVLWSVVTWAILISKMTYFSGVNGKSSRVLQIFRSAGSLADAAKNAKSYRDNPFAKMLVAAADEVGTGKKGGLGGRVQARLSIVQAEAGETLSSGMGIFATVGSISAFVGLFGTVWGIMNSFQSIAATKNTSLAVVAPGIAEALFATALGLVAAIPAVIAYNKISSDLDRYAKRLENFSGEFGAILSRQLEEKI